MALRDAVRRLFGRQASGTVDRGDDGSASVPERPDEVDRDRVRRLARDAADEGVTESLLAGEEGHTDSPPVAYLDEDEQVEYALPAGRVWFGEDVSVRADEVPSKRTLVLVTDRRILVLVGKRWKDSVWGIPLASVDLANVKYGDREAYLVVEAEHEDTPQTFFVELHAAVDVERFRELTWYCNNW